MYTESAYERGRYDMMEELKTEGILAGLRKQGWTVTVAPVVSAAEYEALRKLEKGARMVSRCRTSRSELRGFLIMGKALATLDKVRGK